MSPEVISAIGVIILGITAMLITGFTSYIRYCFPLLILAPILQFKIHAEKHHLLCK